MKRVDPRGGCGGFTLIEFVVALSVFMMVTVFSISLLRIASGVYARIVLEAELLENARIGMESILAHVREAEGIALKADADTGTLEELVATVRKGTAYHDYRFTYDRHVMLGQPRYHRLEFGNNELASHISDARTVIEDRILYITITAEIEGMPDDVRPIVLKASIDLRYKKINEAL